MSVRHRAWLLLGVIALVAAQGPRALAEPAAAPAADDKLADYRGKGQILIAMDPVNLTIQMEQVYRKPSSILLTLDLAGVGLRQSFLTEAGVEQSYNPVQGLIVEKRFKNLEKSATSPLTALQASMYDLGRKVRTAQTRRALGTENRLGYECDVVELESKEIFQDISASGLLGGQKGNELRAGKTKVWLIREFGLPARIELYGSGEQPAMTVTFTELKINTGVGNGDMRLNVPDGTRKISVTADLADPEWESKMDEELRQLLAKVQQEKAAQKPAGGS